MTLIEKRILEIILKLYTDEEKTDSSLDEFAIFISSITPFLGDACFAQDVRHLCNQIGLEIDDNLSDPDWPDDPEGSVIINSKKVVRIKDTLEAIRFANIFDWSVDMESIQLIIDWEEPIASKIKLTSDSTDCDLLVVKFWAPEINKQISKQGVCWIMYENSWRLFINHEQVGEFPYPLMPKDTIIFIKEEK